MKIEQRHPTPRLGPGGYLLDIPENQEFIRRLRATPSLTPAQLVRLSKVYRRNPALASLADHLFKNAVRMVAATWVPSGGTGVNPAAVAFWRELGGSEEGLEPEGELTPSHESPESPEFPGLPGPPLEICEFKCTGGQYFSLAPDCYGRTAVMGGT
jgi:hypothetical protein